MAPEAPESTPEASREGGLPFLAPPQAPTAEGARGRAGDAGGDEVSEGACQHFSAPKITK